MAPGTRKHQIPAFCDIRDLAPSQKGRYLRSSSALGQSGALEDLPVQRVGEQRSESPSGREPSHLIDVLGGSRTGCSPRIVYQRTVLWRPSGSVYSTVPRSRVISARQPVSSSTSRVAAVGVVLAGFQLALGERPVSPDAGGARRRSARLGARPRRRPHAPDRSSARAAPCGDNAGRPEHESHAAHEHQHEAREAPQQAAVAADDDRRNEHRHAQHAEALGHDERPRQTRRRDRRRSTGEPRRLPGVARPAAPGRGDHSAEDREEVDDLRPERPRPSRPGSRRSRSGRSRPRFRQPRTRSRSASRRLMRASCEVRPRRQITPPARPSGARPRYARGMTDRHRVVILGAGFAGSYVARYLGKRRDRVKVTLIDPRNYMLYTPLDGRGCVGHGRAPACGRAGAGHVSARQSRARPRHGGRCRAPLGLDRDDRRAIAASSNMTRSWSHWAGSHGRCRYRG